MLRHILFVAGLFVAGLFGAGACKSSEPAPTTGDAAGYDIPVLDGTAFDVPVLDGTAFDVEDAAVRDADASTCVECMAQTVSWVWRGGYDAGVEVLREVRYCREHEVLSRAGATTVSCASPLRGCGEGNGVSQLQRALAHPDVQAALREDAPRFGHIPGGDLRHREVHVDGRHFLIGQDCAVNPCPTGMTYRPIPPGVRELIAVLDAVSSDAEARCGDAGARRDVALINVRRIEFQRRPVGCDGGATCIERVSVLANGTGTLTRGGQTRALEYSTQGVPTNINILQRLARDTFTHDRLADPAPCAPQPAMGPVERIEVELGDGAVLARDVTGCWSSPYREARAAFDEILRVVRP